MSRQQSLAHYHRLLTRWPRDLLRPEERQFQRLLQTRISSPPPSSGTSLPAEINAAYLLLDDTFTKRFPLSQKMLRPASDEAHYDKIAREVEEAPGRSWWTGVMNRVRGMVRLQ